MQSNRLATSAFLLWATSAALAGCASTAPEYVTYLGSGDQRTTVTSLQAGDMLGRAIYINDIILAARTDTDPATSSLANVEEEQD